MIGLQALLAMAFAMIVSAPARPTPPRVAAPSVIVFSGPLLKHRIVLRNFKENLQLMGALESSNVGADTVGRDHIDVAMFYVRSAYWYDRPVDSIPLEFADMRGRYYPAQQARPALLMPRVVLSGGMLHESIVGEQGQQILAKYGIPIGPVRTR